MEYAKLLTPVSPITRQKMSISDIDDMTALRESRKHTTEEWRQYLHSHNMPAAQTMAKIRLTGNAKKLIMASISYRLLPPMKLLRSDVAGTSLSDTGVK